MSKNIKKKKKPPFFYRLFAILVTLVTLFLIGSITSLNVLNFFLYSIIILIILLISSISIFLMLKSKIKKIGFTFSLILVIIFSILIFYLNKTSSLLNNLNLDYKTYNYSVIVLKSNNYQKINDINNLNIGYYDDGSIEGEKALKKVLNQIKLKSISYEDTHTLADDLLKEEIAAIILEDTYIEILNENPLYGAENFINRIDKIYSFTIKTNTSDIAKDINVIEEPFNIYLSGIDTYGSIASVSRSDVNMIISVNPDKHQILLTSIPRDYYVQVYGKNGYNDKLTHAGLYGVDTSIKTLENLLDTPINYYIKVNFSSVIDIIDAIGGINVYSDYSFTSIDNYNYTEGYNKLNGEEALSFARERKAFIEGDRQRVRNQQIVFKAIFDKCTSKEIITKYNKLLDSLMGSFVTNMKTSRITSLVRNQLNNNKSWNIITNSLEGSDSSNYTYSTPKYKSYVMIPDETSIIEAKSLINKVINGKELNSESELVNKNIDNNLKVKLVRSSITLTKGEEYIYHGYTAIYKGKDITNDKDIKEEFIINNKTFTDYRELVRYITYNLESGTYTITYNITYKEETKVLNQEVIIKNE